jgi:hypothetical protein
MKSFVTRKSKWGKTMSKALLRTAHSIRSLARIGFLAAFALVVTSRAQAAVAKPLPPSVSVNSTIATVDNAVTKMYFGGTIKVPANLSSKLVATEDITDVEVAAIEALIADKSVPNSQKELYWVRYTMGNPKADAVLIKAKKAGIPTTAVIDFNPIMTYSKFTAGQKITSDFKNGTWSTEPGAMSVQRLIAGGFKLGEDLLSQPIYNPAETLRVPIMHEKLSLLRSGKKKITIGGTANAGMFPRVNRMLIYNDPLIFDAYEAHVMALADNYRAGRETKQLPVTPRTKIVYKDGTWFEVAFTNGQFNPNDRVVDAINNQDFDGALFSEFAPTNRTVMVALGAKMQASPKDVRTFIVSDDKFTTTSSYGVTPVLLNLTVYAPFAPIHGFGEAVASHIDSFVWQRRAVDPTTKQTIFQTDDEDNGPPTDRWLWHDKTSIIYSTDEKNNKMADAFTGSFNLSNNVVNAENQNQIRARADSILIQAIDYSVREMVREYPQYAVPAIPAITRSTVAKTLKLGTMDVALDDVDALLKALEARNVPSVASILKKISMSPTHMDSPLSPKEKSIRIAQFVKFLNWGYKTLPRFPEEDTAIKKALGIGLILANHDMSIGQRVSIFKDAVTRPGMDSETIQGLVEQLNGLLGFPTIPKEIPPETSPDDPEAGDVEPGQIGFNADLRYLEGVSDSDATVFDFDNTLATLKTKIRLFKIGSPKASKDPNDIADLSSADFARSKASIGKSGKYQDFEVRSRTKYGDANSFVYFEPGYIVKDLQAAMRLSPKDWKGPAFDSWIERLRTPGTADLTYYSTARMPSEEEFTQIGEIIRAYIQRTEGFDITLPKFSNLFSAGSAPNVAQAKAAEAQKLGIALAKKGVKKIFFFDDDGANIAAVAKAATDPKFLKAAPRLKIIATQVVADETERFPAPMAPPEPVGPQAAPTNRVGEACSAIVTGK